MVPYLISNKVELCNVDCENWNILNIFSSIPQAEASLGMLKREYMHESLNYVLKIQDVQERIKFDFVEILLGFMSGELTTYKNDGKTDVILCFF